MRGGEGLRSRGVSDHVGGIGSTTIYWILQYSTATLYAFHTSVILVQQYKGEGRSSWRCCSSDLNALLVKNMFHNCSVWFWTALIILFLIYIMNLFICDNYEQINKIYRKNNLFVLIVQTAELRKRTFMYSDLILRTSHYYPANASITACKRVNIVWITYLVDNVM